jgi:hypothetical protein
MTVIVVEPKTISDLAAALKTWLPGQTQSNGQPGLCQAVIDELTTNNGLHVDQMPPGGPTKYDPEASPNEVGVLPGWFKDGQYFPDAQTLQQSVDQVLLDLYALVSGSAGSSSNGGLYTAIANLATTLEQVANDYSKGQLTVWDDLTGLGKNLGQNPGGTT